MAQLLRTAADFHPDKLRQLTAMFTGGAPLTPAEIDIWLNAGIPIVNGFGMSEAGTVFGMPVDAKIIAAKPGSVGVGTPGIGARIVDGDERECSDGVAGELMLRGENIFSGYWQRPEESAQAFTEEGWFRTGDIAMRDGDGFHWIVDRKKDMFISGGENVYPAEIESVLAGYPGLSEFAVVGVPDEQWGEVGHLVVVVEPGSTPDARALIEFLRGSLAHYKVPKHVSFWDRLPRTSTGKIQKKALRVELLQKNRPVSQPNLL